MEHTSDEMLLSTLDVEPELDNDLVNLGRLLEWCVIDVLIAKLLNCFAIHFL